MKKGIITVSVLITAVALVALAVTFVGMDFRREIRLELSDTEEVYTLHFTLKDTLGVSLKNKGSFLNKFDKEVKRGKDERDVLMEINEGFIDIIERLESMEREEIAGAIEFFGGKNDPFDYKEGESGYRLSGDIYRRLIISLDSGESVKNVFDETAPISIEDMKKLTLKRITFSTDFSTSSDARKHNIKLATEKLNGRIVEQGDKFSFNETVGSRNEENGYKKAKTMLSGRYIEDFGGGVCQVSTTLYNAWVRSGLDVGYYKAHSMAVSYVALSSDAMVSEYNDLILVNNSENTIYVSAFCENNKIFIELYGVEQEYQYEIESEYIGGIPIEEEIVGDIDIEGEYLLVVENEGSEGFESQSHLVKKKDGNVIDKILLRKDKYGGERRIVRRVPKVSKKIELNTSSDRDSN